MSADITKQLEEKKAKLEELKASKPKANCAGTFSSEVDVRRMTEIEELEEEIAALEGKL